MEPSPTSESAGEAIEFEDRVRDVRGDGVAIDDGSDVFDAEASASDVESAGYPAADKQSSQQRGTEPAEDIGAAGLVGLSEEERNAWARMEKLSDGELLELVSNVKRQSRHLDKLEKIRPNPSEGQRLEARIERLEGELWELIEQDKAQEQVIEDLGPRRSLWYPFGSPKKEVDLAEFRLHEIRNAIGGKARDREALKAQLKEWNKLESFYQERLAPVAHLAEARRDLALKPVRTRLESIRAEQERQGEIQREVYRMERWREVAEAIGKPQKYLDRIEAVTEDIEQGQLVSERAAKARAGDISTYQTQLLSNPNSDSEIDRLITWMQRMLQKSGHRLSDGTNQFEGKNWLIKTQGVEIDLVRQRDGVTVFKKREGYIERYCPTPSERKHLAVVTRLVTKPNRQLKRRLSRGR